MDARLQRRVQRYGWDLAAGSYEPLWQAQLAGAQVKLLEVAGLAPGERVLDVACGTGMVSFPAARAVGPVGEVIGVDLSGCMVDACRRRADVRRVGNARFARMDAERLELTDASFDVVLCSLGLMYMPDPVRALREMGRVLCPGGRIVLAVWGDPRRCGWSALFPIIAAEVTSDVCPLFFHMGQGDALEAACLEAGLEAVEVDRIAATIEYASEDEACNAAFVGGPVALAWSRLDGVARERVRRAYLAALGGWRQGRGYRIPAEFAIARATRLGALGTLAKMPEGQRSPHGHETEEGNQAGDE